MLRILPPWLQRLQSSLSTHLGKVLFQMECLLAFPVRSTSCWSSRLNITFLCILSICLVLPAYLVGRCSQLCMVVLSPLLLYVRRLKMKAKTMATSSVKRRRLITLLQRMVTLGGLSSNMRRLIIVALCISSLPLGPLWGFGSLLLASVLWRLT